MSPRRPRHRHQRLSMVLLGSSSLAVGAVMACGSFGSATEPGPAATLPPTREDGSSPIVCPEETVVCGAACVKPDANDHCGSCGTRCGEGSTCWSDRCRSGSPVGCSDGVRDAFVDASAYPEIAGCFARFGPASLRAGRTDAGAAGCGNDLGGASCPSPADACERGWHVCGQPPFGRQEILRNVTEAACNGETGRNDAAALVAAVGDQVCEPCHSEGFGAVCCGVKCVQQNGNCLWAGRTAWFGKYGDEENRCGSVVSRHSGSGVLCCHDPDPADAGDAGT